MKLAGIDVHKKVLMVACRGCEYAGRETSAATIRYDAERAAPPLDVVAGAPKFTREKSSL